MNQQTALTRREFLKLSLAASVTVLISSQLPEIQALQHPQQSQLPARLAAILTHKDSANVIGLAYTQQHPQEANAHTLLDRIVSSSTTGELEQFDGTDESLRQLLDGMIREDFGHDRIVKLQGWVLAITEARLCALAALL
jgi:hypothetical protein